MNYYPFHLGDYASHTSHLEPLEDLAYRRMLDAYYLREMPLPADPAEVARLVRMRPNLGDVEAVLREFFTLTDEGWRHTRCDEEIERMQDKQAKARASAAASVNARRAKAEQTSNERLTDVERTLNDRSTDVELPTPTPTPTPYSVPSGTDGGAVALKSASDLTKDELWKAGKSLLAGAGMPDAQCGSFVGKLVRDYGNAVVVEVVRSAVVERPADPASFMVASCLARGGKRPKSKQASLEARNAEVAARWVPPELREVGNAI